MTDTPESPADPRPNDEPYYIDNDCPTCGTELIPYDEVPATDRRRSDALVGPAYETGEEAWHDEFVCPDCLDGVHMDWPDDYNENLQTEEGTTFVKLDSADESEDT